jgi:DNA helicase-2/ATP-dependent DNA helicase PcrA
VFGARQFGLPSRFIGEIPAGLTDREEQEAAIRRVRSGAGATISRGVAGLRARATTWDRSGGDGGGWHDPAAPAPAAYRLGEDVVHPTFGEGVVTGIEPGGIVVIRFSRDRLERKLVADLAPINRR